jgi:hypothetical protein
MTDSSLLPAALAAHAAAPPVMPANEDGTAPPDARPDPHDDVAAPIANGTEGTGAMRAAAHAYAARGWPVLPLCWPDDRGQCACPRRHTKEQEIGKAPLTDHGAYSATTDLETIGEWWTVWPEANIGVALEPAGLLVVDADSPEALKDARRLSGLAGLPPAPIARTGRREGGFHWYFRRPEDCRIGSIAKRGASHAIDVKTNGYVIVPPSRHRSGLQYTLQSAPDVVPLGPPPAWPVDWLAERATARANGAVHFAADAAADGAEVWAEVSPKLDSRIVRAVEGGPDAYTPLEGGDSSRSGCDAAVCFALVQAGLPDDAIRAVYQAMPIGRLGKYRDRGDDYLALTLGNMRAHAASGARAPDDLAQQLDAARDTVRKLREDARAGPAAAIQRALEDPDTIDALVLVQAHDPRAFETLRVALRNEGHARARDVDALVRAVSATGRRRPGLGAGATAPYEETPGGLVWLKATANGPAQVPVPLTNFRARIASDVVEDDGAEVRHLYEIEARLGPRPARFTVPAAAYRAMNWPAEHLGPRAIVYPGFGLQEHARCAIQILSSDIPERRVFAHLGWRQIEGQWMYLHADGALGANGPVAGVEVRAPAGLAAFVLPDPPAGQAAVEAIQASLRILALADKPITVPVLATVARAVLGGTDFTLHLVGPTHVGKTELVTLAQQHFGAGMDARHLPGSWSSTSNSLEALAFAAKDALLVVDDFAPSGTPIDVQRYHREADRLIRAQGNRSGRQRMRADGSLRPAKPPRGLLVSTGEDVPRGQSLRGRTLVLEVGEKDLDFGRLTACQQDAAAGLYAQALAGFVQWLAPRYVEISTRLRAEAAALREQAVQSGQHRRTPGIVADLALGLHYLLEYAQDAAALTEDDADALWERGWRALGAVAEAQVAHQEASEPARRFLELLGAAIARGTAHLAAPEGGEPEAPEGWGWRERRGGALDYAFQRWEEQGPRVGWIDGEDVYLEPDAAFAAAQAVGQPGGDALAVTPQTLHRRLHERGLLASTDTVRQRLTVRRVLEKRRRSVLHVHARAFSLLAPPSGNTEPAQPAHGQENTGQTVGRVAGKPAHEPAQPAHEPAREPAHEPAQRQEHAQGFGGDQPDPMGRLVGRLSGEMGRLSGPPAHDLANENEAMGRLGRSDVPEREPSGETHTRDDPAGQTEQPEQPRLLPEPDADPPAATGERERWVL